MVSALRLAMHTWIVTVTFFTTYPQAGNPQERREYHWIPAPAAADAVTIVNIRFGLPRRGEKGTATAGDWARITDIEWRNDGNVG